MHYLVDPPAIPSVPVQSSADDDDGSTTTALFPVHRIYCVGRNYAEHVQEMGGNAQKDAPVFFCKPADAILHCPSSTTKTAAAPAAATTTSMPFPLATHNLHHEVELVLAIGQAGTQIPTQEAAQHIVAYGVGLDLTRRDVQAAAKKTGAPWDVAKALDHGAPMATLVTTASTCLAADAKIWCKVNGEVKQEGRLNQMIWSNAEIVHHLSCRFHLRPGDLIFTGTPAGVGPLQVGDIVEAGIDGLPTLKLSLVER